MRDLYANKVTYKKGDIIAVEGEKSTECFVLISGWVGIFKNNVKLDDYNIPGSVFGEISMMLHKNRTAHIIALSDCEILKLKGDLEDIIRGYPNVAKKILISLAEKLRKTTENFTIILDEEIQKEFEGLNENL
ncbi:MAG TPA: cyclic nucleotide-binding domain-containing protein [Ignavibacteriales bacterium]|nr:cyclic nucleotide-binding domain-containing protein [Ignavibacteriales bacterium]HOL80665.1 cyclic nucleotide-binding domain-containing protein [Ignavibacteriales bacterium]HOM64353.1 cyclic nucleotide-binding domain-containing protein [Ignavibacteriales bacterium]HPD67141.1 cyclic nucleotide-binding domain-containing protein [Ignavibacteriales bacterium]HPP33002.1 cyclic nucleotide-binding domain-containing protein [Ignavibacteriales bacterium]